MRIIGLTTGPQVIRTIPTPVASKQADGHGPSASRERHPIAA